MKTCALSSLASFLHAQSKQKHQQFSSLSCNMLTRLVDRPYDMKTSALSSFLHAHLKQKHLQFAVLGCNMPTRMVNRTYDIEMYALSLLANFLQAQSNKGDQ